jgi:hypothetical protein
MSLVYPTAEDEVVTGEGRLHALVIGVGDYDHLGLGVPKPSRLLSGMAPLTITSPAARKIAAWLENHYSNSERPLGSIELLLSPAGSYTRKDGAAIQIEKATMANIEGAANRWFQRCNASDKNIVFFYFAGHGISAVIGRFLLPADFGNPDLADDWKNCIDAGGLQSGMTKCNAQQQYFFFDACRDAPVSALTQKHPHGDPLVGGADFDDTVELSAEYAAASEGRQAFGRDGGETFFCEALIMCLEGMGASRRPGTQSWRVDAATLGIGLVSVMQAIAERENEPLSCESRIQKPVPLHFPKSGRVIVKVNFNSETMKNEATITFTQGDRVKVSPAGERRPWVESADAGQAEIKVTYTSFPPDIVSENMPPPVFDLELPL